MNDPPTPGFPSNWSSLLTGLTWAYVKLSGDQNVGQFVDSSSNVHYLVAVAAGSLPSAGVQWLASTTAPSNGVPAVLFTSAAASILLGGTVNANGTITYSSVTYRIQFEWNGTDHIAKPITP